MADEGKTYTQDQMDETVKGLKDKNTELHGKLSDVQKTMKQFEGIDMKQLQKDSKAFQKLQVDKDKESGDFKKLYGQLTEQHTKEIGEKDTIISNLQGKLGTLEKSTALNAALVKAHVEPDMQASANKLLVGDLALNDEGVPMVGDKSVNDFVADWAGTTVGKRFVSDGNSGGSGNGPGGNVDNDSLYFDPKSEHFNKTKQSDIARKSPEKYKKYKKQFKK